MKKILISFIGLTLVIAGCQVTPAHYEEDEGSTFLTVDVRVSNALVEVKSNDITQVGKYDLFIFNQNTDGQFLERYDLDLVPQYSETVPGENALLLDKLVYELPTSGTKRIVAIANADANNVSYPTLTTTEEGTAEDYSDVTNYDDFCSAVTFDVSTTPPSSPFILSGTSIIADAGGATAFVTLASPYTRLDVENTTPGTAISGYYVKSIKIMNVPGQCWPLVNDFNTNAPTSFVDYQSISVDGAGSVTDQIYIPYTPGIQAGAGADYRVGIEVTGKYDGNDTVDTLYTISALYPDYLYNLTLTYAGGVLYGDFTPDWSSGSLSISGDLLYDNTLTFPWLMDNWGLDVTYQTDIVGAPSLILGEGSWFTTELSSGVVNVKMTEDNDTGTERTSEVTLTVGSKAVTITIVQQPFPTGTVKFNERVFMDRNLGATVAADAEGVLSPRSYGFYYQWARNVSFPTYGDVTTVSTDSQRTVADAQEMTEFITSSGDWNTYNSPNDRVTTWKDMTGEYGDPCPEGWHIPTYVEIQRYMPYTNGAGVGNFASTAYLYKTDELDIDLVTNYSCLYVTGGSSNPTIYAIKKYGTDDAYYMRWTRVASGNIGYLQLDTMLAGADANFDGYDRDANTGTAATMYSSAQAIWAAANEADIETLYFPGNGYRSNSTGAVADQGVQLNQWAARCWDGSSSCTYFDAINQTSNYRIYDIARARALGASVRCVQDLEE